MSTKSFNKKKTRTFLSTRSPTQMLDYSSPPPLVGQELIHLSHPQHPLVQVSSPYLFTCLGCKEYGAGNRFKCKTCDLVHLHEFCVLAPPLIQKHPLHSHHQLVFYTKPGAGNGFLRSRCNICSKATRGYAYRCSTCNFEMHPCCSKLSVEMQFSVHPHTLKLLPATAALSSSVDSNFVCAECNTKRLGKVYSCKVCDYHLHAVCAKGMVNGLHDIGIIPPEKPSMLGAAAKIASHVIMGFLGGIIEGIGEGIGEVLVENVGRGKSSSGRKSSN